MNESSPPERGFNPLRGLQSGPPSPTSGDDSEITPWAAIAPPVGQGRSVVWRVIGGSVTGASHERTSLPNQDAIEWSPSSSPAEALILAVSDGHGSAKCFRSHVGSQFAVATAIRILQQIIEGHEGSNPSAIKRVADEWLPQNLVRNWRDAVEADLHKNPLTSAELEAVEQRDGATARHAVEENPALAYGATVLAAAVTETYIVYLQLGDGDILTVADTCEVSRPLPKDERLIANETTSLCSADAWRDFCVHFQVLSDVRPALILLSSDGYANSFRDEPSFLKVGSDFLRLIRTEGAGYVEGNLESWLAEASQSGSGDDITLGIIKRGDVDSVDQQVRAIQVQLNQLEDCVPRVEAHEKRFDALGRIFSEAKQRNAELAKQLHRVRLGVLLALFVAGINFGVVVTLLLRYVLLTPTGVGR